MTIFMDVKLVYIDILTFFYDFFRKKMEIKK